MGRQRLVKLPAELDAELVERAHEERVSVPELMRRLVAAGLEEPASAASSELGALEQFLEQYGPRPG